MPHSFRPAPEERQQSPLQPRRVISPLYREMVRAMVDGDQFYSPRDREILRLDRVEQPTDLVAQMIADVERELQEAAVATDSTAEQFRELRQTLLRLREVQQQTAALSPMPPLVVERGLQTAEQVRAADGLDYQEVARELALMRERGEQLGVMPPQDPVAEPFVLPTPITPRRLLIPRGE